MSGQAVEPRVIYEEKDFIALDKPAGLLVHEIANRISHGIAQEPTLVDWLLKHYPEVRAVGDDLTMRPGIVHRLDRDTSGIMLVPRTQAYFEYLKSLFQKHEIQKTYLAVVYGTVKDDTDVIDRPIGIKSGTTKRSVRSEKMQKSAITEYKVIRRFTRDGAEYSLLEVQPKTGRTHQIRVHLASIGHPILGDALYTKRERPEWVHRLMLHAASLEFAPRQGEHLRLEAEVPESFRAF